MGGLRPRNEENQAMSVVLDKGLEVTALHNHFFFDKPKVYFMHIGGEGPVDKLAKGVRAVFEKEKEIRTATPQPADAFGVGVAPAKSAIDGQATSQVFGLNGGAKD